MRFVLEVLATLAFLLLDTVLGVARDVVRIALAPRGFLATSRAERFIRFEHRAWFTGFPLSLQFYTRTQNRKLNRSRSAVPTINWKGVQTLKDPFELALYPLLLWELQPATIIELGSYMGGSAVWLADLLSVMGVDGRVHSFDIDLSRIQARHDRVTFEYADCNDLSTFPTSRLKDLPHPWLLIEDAHRNVYEVLRHFDALLRPGDYLVVEDVFHPRNYVALRRFVRETHGRYLVDTHYTDMFAYNATWNFNGYLKRG